LGFLARSPSLRRDAFKISEDGRAVLHNYVVCRCQSSPSSTRTAFNLSSAMLPYTCLARCLMTRFAAGFFPYPTPFPFLVHDLIYIEAPSSVLLWLLTFPFPTNLVSDSVPPSLPWAQSCKSFTPHRFLLSSRRTLFLVSDLFERKFLRFAKGFSPDCPPNQFAHSSPLL